MPQYPAYSESTNDLTHIQWSENLAAGLPESHQLLPTAQPVDWTQIQNYTFQTPMSPEAWQAASTPGMTTTADTPADFDDPDHEYKVEFGARLPREYGGSTLTIKNFLGDAYKSSAAWSRPENAPSGWWKKGWETVAALPTTTGFTATKSSQPIDKFRSNAVPGQSFVWVIWDDVNLGDDSDSIADVKTITLAKYVDEWRSHRQPTRGQGRSGSSRSSRSTQNAQPVRVQGWEQLTWESVLASAPRRHQGDITATSPITLSCTGRGENDIALLEGARLELPDPINFWAHCTYTSGTEGDRCGTMKISIMPALQANYGTDSPFLWHVLSKNHHKSS